MRRGIIAAVVIAGVVLVAGGVVLSVTLEPITQPIAFSHQLHVEDLGSECSDCHLYVQTGIRATIPNAETCSDCHYEAITESQEEARLIEYIEADTPIPWRKIYWVEDHVFFSHRRHTAVAGIECETCHGPVGGMAEPVTRKYVPITMDRCMQCHAQTDASNDCIVCHR